MLAGIRKASAEPRLDLYALALVRASDIERELAHRCGDCPGTGAGCKPHRGVVAGRSDWPLCPRAMTRNPAAQECADLYVAAQISPLAGFPQTMSAWGFDMLMQIKQAVRSEDERKARERAQSGGPGKPQFTGRRSAREV